MPKLGIRSCAVAFFAVLVVGASACTTILGDFDSQQCAAGAAGCDGGVEASTKKCTDPGAPVCGTHGTCVDTSGAAICNCTAGYTGPTCAACATGFVLAADKTCNPGCATANLTCPAHGKCDDTSGKAVCACATGYTLDSTGKVCNWTGGPLDPTLTIGAPPWVVVGGSVNTTGAGQPPSNKGIFIAPRDQICRTDTNPITSSLAQTFTMPAAADAEPFALHIVDQINCGPAGVPGCNDGSIPFDTSLNYPQDRSLPTVVQATMNTWQDHQFCIGERGYGPNVGLVIGQLSTVTGPTFFCNPGATNPLEFQIDSVTIQPSKTCPAVGTVANGDFESTTAPWAQVGTAQVAQGVGTGGSQAGRLSATTGCPSPRPALISQISVPSTSLPSPQLTFSFNGPTTRQLGISIAGLGFGVLGTGATQTVSVCLPDYPKGYAVPFQIEMEDELDATGSCAGTVATRQIIVDDFKIVSNPGACAASLLIQDPGFEKAPLLGTSGVYAWQLASSGSSGGLATFDTADKNSGSASVTLSVHKACDTSSAATTITVPSPVGTAGPVAKFFYRVSQNALTGTDTATYTAGVAGLGGPSASGASMTVTDTQGAWKAAQLCIPPKLAKLGATLRFAAATSGLCADTANGLFGVDDVTIGTAAACPAQ